jgi:SAM-dependent methyltransferase
MKYATHLKKIFKDTRIDIEDLLLLKPFQISYLPERVPQKEFATLLRAYPIIHRFLQKKEPSIKLFLDKVLNENKPITHPKAIKEQCNDLLWEIGELIIYNKYPETYDEKIEFTWNLDEIVAPDILSNKTVADVGAGSGMLTSLLTNYAKIIYAIEPLSSFRCFMRKRFREKQFNNIYVVEGFLDRIPLADQSLDILFTSNALGWDFDREQKEIKRVVKPGGQVIHIMRAFDKDVASPYHEKLLENNYQFQKINDEGFKAKYYKIIQ